MKKFTIIALMLFCSTLGMAQNKKDAGVKMVKIDTSSETTDSSKNFDPSRLIAVTTVNKDTLFFSNSEPVCKTIAQVWDMGKYPDRPVILFVSNEQLQSAYLRTQAHPKIVNKKLKN